MRKSAEGFGIRENTIPSFVVSCLRFLQTSCEIARPSPVFLSHICNVPTKGEIQYTLHYPVCELPVLIPDLQKKLRRNIFNLIMHVKSKLMYDREIHSEKLVSRDGGG
ncbi:hypothetical protein AVEN_176090-1 [Araneus ventricosus]|uniref:Uncharacterized protein n=1 Tax=Araneus ventricosus TaxID=182803 RepID=A0A4Y2RXU4_ARAVE|nr:hypothetical protein AVEN_176090-1 [Araneus ventricosus]